MYYYNNRPIEIIGTYKDFYVAIINGFVWGLSIYNIKKAGFGQPTRKEIEETIKHLNPTQLLMRLRNPTYLPGSRQGFMEAIKLCYHLTETERRLIKMYSVEDLS